MGMYKNISDIIKRLKNDEILLRLLYYKPKSKENGYKDPLDPSLPNILDKNQEELSEIREKRFLHVPKSDDLVKEPICRLYIYAGKRDPERTYNLARQEIIIDVLCHMEFEKDLRSMRICDRLNELLVNQMITGIGNMQYVGGSPVNTVPNYVQYKNAYRYGVGRR